jgi:hypothetical protein
VGDRVVRLDDPPRVERPLIEQESIPESQDRAVRGSRDLRLVSLLAGVGRALQVLSAQLDPPDRTAKSSSDNRNQDVLGVDATLRPEPPTDVGGDDPDLVGRQAERLGERPLNQVGDLGRCPDGHPPVPRIGHREDPPRFERHPRGSRHPESLAQPNGRLGEGPVRIAHARRKAHRDIVAPLFVDERRAAPQALLDVGDGR